MKKEAKCSVKASNIQRKVAVDIAMVERAAMAVLEEEDMGGELSVLVCDDDYIGQLNKKYQSGTGPTDVLSFPMDSDGLIGDVAVSAERAAEQAPAYGQAPREEILRLVIHGTLHLAGYDDLTREGAEAMEARQEEILRRLLG